jgi:predicted NAD-dependent protein-ADP-ribosyltransferase YbiA (DUF1768 family)
MSDFENIFMVRLKFDQNLVLKRKLLITGDHIILENIGSRNGERHLFWGMKKVNGEWIGNNMMGRILMELRDEFREEAEGE